MNTSIPKRIFQTDRSHTVRPEWTEGPPSLKNIALPGWKYEFYDHDDMDVFVKQNYMWYYETWMSFPHVIMKVDTFRYMKLHKDGGFYCDMDFKFLRNIEHLFYDPKNKEPTKYKVQFAKSVNDQAYWTNSIMASIPGHSIWLEFLKETQNYIETPADMVKSYTVMYRTGPAMITRVLNKYTNKELEDMNIGSMPKEINLCDMDEIGIVKPGSWTVALKGQSWLTDEEKFIANSSFKLKKACGGWLNFILIIFFILVIIIIIILLVVKYRTNAITRYSSPFSEYLVHF